MLNILDEHGHPALGSLLAPLRHREEQSNRGSFRRNMALIGTLMAYEIGRTLEGREKSVPTPLGERSLRCLRDYPILATALRAGLPFLQGMLEVFPESDTMFFGAARVEGRGPDGEGRIPVDLSYEALTETAGRTVLFVDPMIATGSTIIDIHQRLVDRNARPERFIVAGLVGWRGACDRIHAHIPEAEVWYATCDEELNEQGYIVPGLGDAGDLCYGPKL